MSASRGGRIGGGGKCPISTVGKKRNIKKRKQNKPSKRKRTKKKIVKLNNDVPNFHFFGTL